MDGEPRDSSALIGICLGWLPVAAGMDGMQQMNFQKISRLPFIHRLAGAGGGGGGVEKAVQEDIRLCAPAANHHGRVASEGGFPCRLPRVGPSELDFTVAQMCVWLHDD